MGQPFAENSYIDDQGNVRSGDGEYDEHERWVDQEGYVRMPPNGSGDQEDGIYIDTDGRLHQADGTATDDYLPVPAGILTATATENQFLRDQADDRDEGLSDTQAMQSDPQALAAFQAGITRASLTDAQGNELTWAGGTGPDEYGPLHGHDLQPEFVGEDRAAEAFHHRTKRYESGSTGDDWVTEYDRDQTSSVQEAMVGGGLLRDQQGAPLTGKFGYVISPNDGSMHLFDTTELWVTVGNEWVDLTGVCDSVDEMSEMAETALKAGGHVKSVHHSTPLAGMSVAGAGSLVVDAGAITEITNSSGHYRPEAEYLWQSVAWLKAQGMPIADISVKMLANDHNPEVILKGWQAEQTGGNQAQAAAKAKVNQEVAERGLKAETERAEQQRIAALAQQQNSPAALHFKKTGCNAYMPDSSNTYCMGCDQNL